MRVAGQQLTDEKVLSILDSDTDDIGALSRIIAREYLPTGIDFRDSKGVAAISRLHSHGISRHGGQMNRGSAGDFDDDGSPQDRRLTFDFRAEVPHAADRQNNDAGMDHPYAEIDHLERDAPKRGHHKGQADERNQRLERPPVEPLELRHFEDGELAERRIGAADRAVDEQEDQQHNAGPNARKNVEQHLNQGARLSL